MSGPDGGTRSNGDLGFRRTMGIIWPLLAMPVLVIGGIVAVQYSFDSVESFYTDDALPFLIAYWIGLGFTTGWRLLRESAGAQGASPGILAAVGVLSALVLLSMLGGIKVVWEDPWIFGVAVAPGFALARPLVERWLWRRQPEPTAVARPERPE